MWKVTIRNQYYYLFKETEKECRNKMMNDFFINAIYPNLKEEEIKVERIIQTIQPELFDKEEK